ncbi:MAG: RNA polymerase sigma factor [Prevotella sp.]|jgi:RNA polymerase sigma-70 factor (ECF subfamily)|nr:RNA polymerase sigma factor [Prevotella sp.]
MEDKEIIERIIKHGDTKCYAEIVKRYSGTIYSKVLRLVKQSDMAKDITQQAFIRAYSNLDTWRGGALGGWINAIAMHLALNHLSKMQRQRTDSIEDKPLPDMSDDYSEERENMLSAMDRAIERLPEIDRQIIMLHYYKSKKTSEIATILNLSNSNVLVKLHRIREQLKKEIEYERDK